MTVVKPASTIMLARDKEASLEVLLLKRNKALAFAGGLWVFPGGKIEEEEQEYGEDELAAAKLAAIRETKEETNLDIEIEDLVFFSHWTTPVIEPRRYATWFFFGEVETENGEVLIDDSEIKDHLWINPEVALGKVRHRELAMMPPTLMSLQLIRKCKNVAEARGKLEKQEVLYTLPVLQRVGSTMVCMYEGDAGYESGEAETAGARHRLLLDMKAGSFSFEFENCTGVRPINGGMHL
ncbi:MAG: NUDIX hydrolase [Bacteroidota bacterium]